MSNNNKDERRWQFKLETYGAVLGAVLSGIIAYFLSSSANSNTETSNNFNISSDIANVLWWFLILVIGGFVAKLLYVFNRVSGFIDSDGDVTDADDLFDGDDFIDML